MAAQRHDEMMESLAHLSGDSPVKKIGRAWIQAKVAVTKIAMAYKLSDRKSVV